MSHTETRRRHVDFHLSVGFDLGLDRARVTVRAWACSYPSVRRMGAERVAVDLECPSLVFADGSAERVDGWTDLNIDETGLLEHLSPALTGQPTGDSASPQVDVAQRLWRHGPAVRDVGKLQHGAGP